MPTELKLRRGTTAQHSTFTGASGEITVDTSKKTLVVHDGSTAGGVPLATEAAVNAKQNSDAELTTLAGMSANRATFLASSEGFGFRNRIINGDMRIDQRNNGASISLLSAAGYAVDRWNTVAFGGAAGGFSAQRVTDAPAGFTNSLRITTTTADASITAADNYQLLHQIEGFNTADLGFGTATASAVTLSFWVKSSLTGTHSGSLLNGPDNRSYVFTFTVNAANTWEYKTVTIAGDTTGTWNTDNSVGISVRFNLGGGSNFQGTPGSWAGVSLYAATGAVQLVGTLNATLQLTGVQLEAGSVATPFERRDYGRELIMCQRYYQKSYNVTTPPGTVTNDGYFQSFAHNAFTLQQTSLRFPVFMRANPTVTLFSPSNGASGVVFDVLAGVNRSCGVFNTGNSGGEINGSGNLTAGNYYTFHFVANIEL